MMRTIIRWLLDPWVIVGSLLVAFVLSSTFLLFVYATRAARVNPVVSIAILNKIAAPTFSLFPQTSQSTSGTPPIENPLSTISSGEIHVGIQVQVSGTGGDGLRMRVSPGLGNDVLFVAKDGEIFRVSDGPQEASGYTWWYLVSSLDDTVRGWVVGNFLVVSQNP
jgi:hypothetical protein